MRRLILNALMIISFVIMIGDVILYYEQSTGRITMVIAGIVCSVSHLISEYLENEEEV